MFTKAIVRKPARTYANGITTSNLGKPDFKLALKQHDAYCEALIKCGLKLIVLDPDPEYPDSCFVEDTAVLTKDFGIIARPGDKRRLGEELEIKKVLEPLLKLYSIEDPGSLDGGDIMQAENNFYIGLSTRTNLSGSKQLADILTNNNYEVYSIPVCNLLHFKTGVNYLGDNNLLIHKEFCSKDDFKSYNKLVIDDDEEYAANSLRINDFVITPKGFPKTKESIEKLGYKIIELELSEFQKMDGGLSCLSLRF
ncbi:MAG: arginine deiminase-related protein [Bacteroidales bacterium]|jgi:dimethylargininase|nr:arginine deiminase-related protein [Bacteroidales bacterium]